MLRDRDRTDKGLYTDSIIPSYFVVLTPCVSSSIEFLRGPEGVLLGGAPHLRYAPPSTSNITPLSLYSQSTE